MHAFARFDLCGRVGKHSAASVPRWPWPNRSPTVARTHAPGEDFVPLKAPFSDAKIADLSFAVGLMRACNRLVVGMRNRLRQLPVKTLSVVIWCQCR